MRGVGSLRGLSGSSTPGSGHKSRRKSKAPNDAEDDEFDDIFMSPIRPPSKKPIKSNIATPEAPQQRNPSVDLRGFFSAVAPTDTSKSTKRAASAPNLHSPSLRKPTQRSFEEAVAVIGGKEQTVLCIVDSSSDEETEPKRSAPKRKPIRPEDSVDLTIEDGDSAPPSGFSTPKRAKTLNFNGSFSSPAPLDSPAPTGPPAFNGPRQRPSYYLKNFFLILETVLQKDSHLITEKEQEIVNTFRSCSDDAQRLFVRLIYRRGPWFQVSKIVYHEISDIHAAVTELITAKIMEEPASPTEVIHLLKTPQLKSLIKFKSTQATSREALLEQAKKWMSNQRTLFGTPVVPRELGRCIRVTKETHELVRRLHRLFFLSQTEDQTALTLVHLGRVAFPTYILPGVQVDDGLDGKPFAMPTLVPETFKNPYSLALLEQKHQQQGTASDSVVTPLEPNEESQDPIEIQEVIANSVETANDPSKPANQLRPRWLIDANLTILKHIGFSSVFPNRAAMEEYEATMEKATILTELLGEDLDGMGAATTTGELTGSMNTVLNSLVSPRSGGGGAGGRWRSAAKMNEVQLTQALEIVAEAVKTLEVSPSLYVFSPFSSRDPETQAVVRTHIFVLSRSNSSTFGDDKPEKYDIAKNLFLRRFTAKWLSASMIWVGVSLLERQRNYALAVDYLKKLLASGDVCLGKRGEWWLRLGFDLAHLGRLQEAIDAVVSGLNDSNIRPQQRLALHTKLRILLKAKQRKDAGAADEAAAEVEEADQPEEPSLQINESGEIMIDDDRDDDDEFIDKKAASNPKKRKRRNSSNLSNKRRKSSDLTDLEGGKAAKEPALPEGVQPFVIRDPIERVIQARPLHRGNTSFGYGKSIFVGFEGESEVSVEELALQFYQLKEKFSNGSHCEGSPFSMLYGIFLWDIIFDASVPHVFQTPVQDAPLDFGTEDFYAARKDSIEERLAMIANSSESANLLEDMITDSYSKWYGRVCRCVNWTRWTKEELLDIARCVGGKVLSSIFRRFSMDYRYSHSGLPDLLLWDVPTLRAKLVEVKGPRDRLSDKQRIWIDFLMEAGADIEVLYVREKLKEGEVDDSQDLIIPTTNNNTTQEVDVLVENPAVDLVEIDVDAPSLKGTVEIAIIDEGS